MKRTLLIAAFFLISCPAWSQAVSPELATSLSPARITEVASMPVVSVADPMVRPVFLEARLSHLETLLVFSLVLSFGMIFLLLMAVVTQRQMIERIHHEVEKTQILLEEEADFRPTPRVRSYNRTLAGKYALSREAF